MKLADNIRRYIDAGYPILYLTSFEEEVMDDAIQSAADSSGAVKEILEWNYIDGFMDFKNKHRLSLGDASLIGTLRFLLDGDELEEKILVLKDVPTFVEEPEAAAMLKGIAERISSGAVQCTIIMQSSILNLPKVLEPYVTILEPDLLGMDEIKAIIEEFLGNSDERIGEELLDRMAVAFQGLSRFEIINILSLAYQENGEFTEGHLKLIFEQKKQMILKSGILEMIPLKERLEDIGGLENLKDWLRCKAKIIKDVEKARAFGVDIPKGVLIAGLPGCGKSLSAKAAASLFEVPLLRLDMGRLMGKYVGESEANLRKAIRMAEAISPCVLWVDELEKAFSGVGGDGGGADITTRLFGNFLTWMQEKDNPVFVVATANSIDKLPPELMRKGRFDEIFFVGLPERLERKKIFQIHLQKRRPNDLGQINLDSLAEQSNGYSGADIEGVIKDSVEKVYCDGEEKLQTETILNIIRDTHSISESLNIEKMKEYYKKNHFKNAAAK